MTAPLAWMDVVSTDFETSMRFYAETFDWTREVIVADHTDGYSFLSSEGGVVAGAEPIDPSKGPPRWTVFVQTDDVVATARLAERHGGRVTFAPDTMGTLGGIAMIEDPAGSTVGVWQAIDFDPSATGPVVGRMVGAELTTPDSEAVLPFYTSCLGWTVIDDSDGAVRFDTGGLPALLRSDTDRGQWVPVLGVPDLTAIENRIRDAGGHATPSRSPGLVDAADPCGARFLLAPQALGRSAEDDPLRR